MSARVRSAREVRGNAGPFSGPQEHFTLYGSMATGSSLTFYADNANAIGMTHAPGWLQSHWAVAFYQQGYFSLEVSGDSIFPQDTGDPDKNGIDG